MKVKLLKKIRKQYSIVYYSHGVKVDNCVFHVKQYVLHKSFRSIWRTNGYDTKQEALNAMMGLVRLRYGKKLYKGIKAWPNFNNKFGYEN